MTPTCPHRAHGRPVRGRTPSHERRVTAIFRKSPARPERTPLTPPIPATSHTHVLGKAFGERSPTADAPRGMWTKSRRRPTVEQHHVQPFHLTTLVRPVPATVRGARAQGRPLLLEGGPRRPRRGRPGTLASSRAARGLTASSTVAPSGRSAVEVSHRPHRRTPPARRPCSGVRRPRHGQGCSADVRTFNGDLPALRTASQGPARSGGSASPPPRPHRTTPRETTAIGPIPR